MKPSGDPEVRTEVLVVGAGVSGLAQAAVLAAAGLDFVVLEKGNDIGGTWRDNTYPGASCDVESHLYSYAHDHNPHWSSTYARQPEILAYLRRVAERRGLPARIRLGVAVTAARWDAETCTWRVTTAGGAAYRSRYLVLAVGGLHLPRIPAVPGADTFAGPSWHTARWDHSVELAGRHVTLVGVGASGVQVAPHLAARAAGLTIFQRTAPWVLPKADRPVPARLRRTLRWVVGASALYRLRISIRREKRGLGFHHRPEALRVAEPVVAQQITAHIDDPELRALVTPTYRLGCKRVLFANDYYPALNRPNVRVVAGEPAEIGPDAVVDESGTRHRTDVIVYATGFALRGSYDAIGIEGEDGHRLDDAWRGGMRSYQGVAVPGFPNMFTLLGPNGVVSYTSVVSVVEAQTRYVLRAIRATRRAGADALVVRADAERRFQEDVRRRFERSVWHVGGCRSWYQTGTPSGTLLWPDSTWRYRWLLRTLRRGDYRFLHR